MGPSDDSDCHPAEHLTPTLSGQLPVLQPDTENDLLDTIGYSIDKLQRRPYETVADKAHLIGAEPATLLQCLLYCLATRGCTAFVRPSWIADNEPQECKLAVTGDHDSVTLEWSDSETVFLLLARPSTAWPTASPTPAQLPEETTTPTPTSTPLPDPGRAPTQTPPIPSATPGSTPALGPTPFPSPTSEPTPDVGGDAGSCLPSYILFCVVHDCECRDIGVVDSEHEAGDYEEERDRANPGPEADSLPPRVVVAVDTSAPTVMLLGDGVVRTGEDGVPYMEHRLQVGDVWVEPGVQLQDNFDGKLSGARGWWSPAQVDTSRPTLTGQPLVLFYVVSDKYGNVAEGARRVVSVMCPLGEYVCPPENQWSQLPSCSVLRSCLAPDSQEELHQLLWPPSLLLPRWLHAEPSVRDGAGLAAPGTITGHRPRLRLLGPHEVEVIQGTAYGPGAGPAWLKTLGRGLRDPGAVVEVLVESNEAPGKATRQRYVPVKHVSFSGMNHCGQERAERHDWTGDPACSADTSRPGVYTLQYHYTGQEAGAQHGPQVVSRVLRVLPLCPVGERVCRPSNTTCSVDGICLEARDSRHVTLDLPVLLQTDALLSHLNREVTVKREPRVKLAGNLGPYVHVKQHHPYKACSRGQAATSAEPCEEGAVSDDLEDGDISRSVYVLPGNVSALVCLRAPHGCAGNEFWHSGLTHAGIDTAAAPGTVFTLQFVAVDSDGHIQSVNRTIVISKPCEDGETECSSFGCLPSGLCHVLSHGAGLQGADLSKLGLLSQAAEIVDLLQRRPGDGNSNDISAAGAVGLWLGGPPAVVRLQYGASNLPDAAILPCSTVHSSDNSSWLPAQPAAHPSSPQMPLDSEAMPCGVVPDGMAQPGQIHTTQVTLDTLKLHDPLWFCDPATIGSDRSQWHCMPGTYTFEYTAVTDRIGEEHQAQRTVLIEERGGIRLNMALMEGSSSRLMDGQAGTGGGPLSVDHLVLDEARANRLAAAFLATLLEGESHVAGAWNTTAGGFHIAVREVTVVGVSGPDSVASLRRSPWQPTAPVAHGIKGGAVTEVSMEIVVAVLPSVSGTAVWTMADDAASDQLPLPAEYLERLKTLVLQTCSSLDIAGLLADGSGHSVFSIAGVTLQETVDRRTERVDEHEASMASLIGAMANLKASFDLSAVRGSRAMEAISQATVTLGGGWLGPGNRIEDGQLSGEGTRSYLEWVASALRQTAEVSIALPPSVRARLMPASPPVPAAPPLLPPTFEG